MRHLLFTSVNRSILIPLVLRSDGKSTSGITKFAEKPKLLTFPDLRNRTRPLFPIFCFGVPRNYERWWRCLKCPSCSRADFGRQFPHCLHLESNLINRVPVEAFNALTEPFQRVVSLVNTVYIYKLGVLRLWSRRQSWCDPLRHVRQSLK